MYVADEGYGQRPRPAVVIPARPLGSRPSRQENYVNRLLNIVERLVAISSGNPELLRGDVIDFGVSILWRL